MAKQGRNERCRCGSGRKAKHCCDSLVGPSQEALDRAFVAKAAHDTRSWLGLIDADDLDGYLDKLLVVVRRFPGLGVELPAIIEPALERLLFACEIDDRRIGEPALIEVARRFDTTSVRARLAREIVRLHDEGALDALFTAVALFDLADATEIPLLLEGAVLEAARVRAGRARTPSGLLVAS